MPLPVTPHDVQVNPSIPGDDRYDPWHWVAILTSGQVVEEYCPETLTHRPFAVAVHSGQVAQLALVPRYPDRYPGLVPHVVLVPLEARPIFFRRRDAYVIVDEDAPVRVNPRITCIGWQRTVNGSNVQSLHAFFDDGSSLVTDDRATLG